MSITRPLLAASIVAVLALAGCSAGGDETATDDPSVTEETEGTPTPDLEGVPDVVAVVNGDEISLEEFTSAYEGQFQQAVASQQMTGQEVDQDVLKTQVADLLVNNRLLVQAAQEAGFSATEEDVDAQIEDVATQNGFESAEAVLEAFEEQGVSEEQVRADAATQFEIDQYLEAETDVEEPGEDELRAQYDELVEQAEAQGEEAEGELPPFEDVRDQLAEQAVSEGTNAAIGEILEELRDAGDVTINI